MVPTFSTNPSKIKLTVAVSEVVSRPKWVTLLLLSLVVLALACNSGSREPRDSRSYSASKDAGGTALETRFLLGGWMVPKGESPLDEPFLETLKGTVITSQAEMREFLDSLELLRVRGTPKALDQVDTDAEIVIAVYYKWRPLKGDPLSLLDTALRDSKVEVRLELVEDPQGRDRPYLAAPLYIGAIDRENLPAGVPLEFVFLVNGQESASEDAILEVEAALPLP